MAMNYSTVALVLLMGYMWHANSMSQEIAIIKRLSISIYELLQERFEIIVVDLNALREQSNEFFNLLHNETSHIINMVTNNSKKIDTIDNKIDLILHAHQQQQWR